MAMLQYGARHYAPECRGMFISDESAPRCRISWKCGRKKIYPLIRITSKPLSLYCKGGSIASTRNNIIAQCALCA